MAIPSHRDGLGPSARAAGGSGIVVAVDRGRRVAKARRHSTLVRIMRIALPVGALGIVLFYAGTMLDLAGWRGALPSLSVPKILPEHLTMNNPRYRGFANNGSSYVIEAATAQQDLKNPAVIRLATITGVLTRADKSKTQLRANSGVYNSQREHLLLNGNIRITSDDGAWARLTVAEVEPKTGLISSKQPVAVGNRTSTIRSQAMVIRQKTKEITFTGKVHATLQPAKGDQVKSATAPDPATPPARPAEASTGETAAANASIAKLFAAGGGPVDVHADRLDIDDVKKTAVFTGNVRATRGTSTLTTPELRIAYDGAPSGGLAGSSAQAGEPASRASIKTILAANPVVISNAPDTRVTGQTAMYDAASSTSTIDGGVVIQRGTDTRITAPTATYDQQSGRSTLIGGVAIDRAPSTRVTGRNAAFDSRSDVAMVEGDVVIVSGADRRATGERAEFDNRNKTALLTGNVVLIQGGNILKGTRLYSDQNAKRTELTAAGETGSAPGRISAHFVQPKDQQRKARPAAAKAVQQEGGGFLAVSKFRSNPNAPVDIAADRLVVHEDRHAAVFSGDVQADQGGFKIRTSEMTAFYTGGAGLGTIAEDPSQPAQPAKDKDPAKVPARLERIKANGKVIVTSVNGQSATGDWADFDVKANTATVGGDVVLSQGRNIVRGTKLVIDMTTGEATINSEGLTAPQVSSGNPGAGWRAERKAARPSAVFFPQQLRKAAERSAARKQGGEKKTGAADASTSSWQPTTTSRPPGGPQN
ncbi:MAG: LPS export ABC transporter periplasmic protein LptC [Hyphomicrobiaceae bacterium]